MNVDTAQKPLRMLSLCSGTGMLDLGAELALEHHGIRTQTLGYLEREAFAAVTLLGRMEEQAMEPAPIWCGELESFPWELYRGKVDAITCGFPCPPVSVAGKRKGTADERWIFPAICDLVRRLESVELMFLENVRGLISDSAAFGEVLGLLANLGFHGEWGVLSAAAVGASHRRERVFIVAYRSRGRLRVLRESSWGEGLAWSGGEAMAISARNGRPGSGLHEPEGREQDAHAGGTGGELGNATGHEQRRDRLPSAHGQGQQVGGSSGDVELPEDSNRRRKQQPRESTTNGRTGSPGASRALGLSWHRTRSRPFGDGQAVSKGQRLPQPAGVARDDGEDLAPALRGGGALVEPSHNGHLRSEGEGDLGDIMLFAPGPNDPRWARIIADRSHVAPAVESGVRLLVDGMAVTLDESRADQLRACGNGVVPLQASACFATLLARIAE